MRADIIGYGGGGKGGGGGRAPVESPDSLNSIAYARVLDLISEGEIRGLVNGLQSVYLNETPLMNPDGSFNFQNVSVDYRLGTQDQEYIPGFPAAESETAVGVTLTSSTSWTRSVNNTELSAVRIRLSVPALSKTNTTNGDITGYKIEYAIDLATDGGSFQQVMSSAFDGKTTNKYERSHRIDLPPATTGWTVRVRRITPNANSGTIADTTIVESITEIIDAKLRYPNSAIVGIQIDARQFNSVPTRAYDMYGRVIRVPSNYDPESRTYTGTWDGTFKVAWTNNPAWVFYDLVLNPRYGLGDRINAAMVDKWSLYQIGQYCDEMVPDGKGGQEPRFTCNLYLQTRAEAYKVLQDIASIFRGMAYWAAGNVIAVADMPKDPVYTFTAANVVDGKFRYAGTARKARKTVALVSWNDPSDFGRAKVEYVPDEEGIARYGVRETEVTAIGCTSQGQAQRLGQWILLTSRYETETVSFSVGMDHALVQPGSIVRIADPSRAGRRIGGRIRSASGNSVTLDKADQVAVGDTLIVTLPSGVAQSRTIGAVDGNTVTVTGAWSEPLKPQSVWAVESAELKTQLFRIISIAEGDGINADITALQYEPQKFGAVDHGTRIDPRPITVIPPSVQPPATNVALSTYSTIDQGIAVTTMVISWTPADKAVAYEVEWRRDNSEWVRAGRTGSQSLEVRGIYAGTYVARVRAINALDVPSIPAYSPETVLQGKTSPPPAVTSLVATGLIFAIRLDWGFPTGPLDVERTEIWYSQTNSREDAIKMADFAYPQNSHTIMGLAAGATLYFWARLIDKSGNVGPWYPNTNNGVAGQASSDATEILDYLAGQIGETQLAQDLISKIDRIDPPFAGSIDDYAGDSGVFAGIVSVQSLMQEADMALAAQQTTLQATLDGNTAQVQTTAQALVALDGKISASYTIKVGVTQDGKYYGAGMAIGIGNETGVVQSQILWLADRFAFLNLINGEISTPFVIQNGQTFINQAFIGNASIGSAKFADWLESDAINSLGQRVLRINFRSGAIELNGANAGGRTEFRATYQKIFNGSESFPRVQIGDLSA